MTTGNPESHEVTCPQCSNISEVREGVDTFCPTCDFPLFWADPAETTQRRAVQSAEIGAENASESGSDDDHVHADDELELDAEATDIICRNCATRNPGDRTYCQRCGEELPPPEEWYREGETHVEVESEPSVWRSAAFVGITVFLALWGVFLILHFSPLDLIWPDQTTETKIVVSDVSGISSTAVVMVGDPRVPAISFYGDVDGGTESALSLVICGDTQCGEGKLGPGDIPDQAFKIDPEGTPGRNGLAMVRIAGGPLAVYRREETGSLVAIECGTIGCDDNLGTRLFFPVDEGEPTEDEIAQKTSVAPILSTFSLTNNEAILELSAIELNSPGAAAGIKDAIGKLSSAMGTFKTELTTAMVSTVTPTGDIETLVSSASDAADEENPNVPELLEGAVKASDGISNFIAIELRNYQRGLTKNEISLVAPLLALDSVNSQAKLDFDAIDLSATDAAVAEIKIVAESLGKAVAEFKMKLTESGVEPIPETATVDTRIEGAISAADEPAPILDSVLKAANAAIDELAKFTADELPGTGFSPSMAVSGGVPIVVYADNDQKLRIAFLCESACLDDDGVVNIELGDKHAVDGSLALAVPRAGTPYVAYVKPDSTLGLLGCENVTCSEIETIGSGSSGVVERVPKVFPIYLNIEVENLTDPTRVLPGNNQIGMIIDPNTLAPQIAFLRPNDNSELELRVLRCDDQLCSTPQMSLRNPEAKPEDPIANLGTDDGELVVARGDNGLPVIAYRRVDTIDGEMKSRLFIATCQPCGKDPTWINERVDDGKRGDENAGWIWPVNWWPFDTTEYDDVGYNLSISISDNVALITHTNKSGTAMRATRVDLKKLIQDCKDDSNKCDDT